MIIKAIMNFFLDQNSKAEPRNLAQLRFFLKNGIYQICKEKWDYFSCSHNCETVNQTFLVSNDRKNSMRTQKNILKSSSTLYFEKTKKIKASIWSKPEFELQFHFTAETNNDNISWFWYIYLILSIGLWKRSILEIIWYFLDR